MNDNKLTRREFLLRAAALGAAAAAAPAIMAGCTSGGGGGTAGGITCDTSGLSDAERTMRQSLNYVDQTPNPAQRCDNCQLWVEPSAAGQCGGCQLENLGPVHPAGWCTAWVAAG
ncbi:MAG: hypothetical protein EA398_06365 [Deltaproteobacteria bacterium]|nr:MAG: hypothetical protein EA398_06365 [Deltaproteobacteria bacterium]